MIHIPPAHGVTAEDLVQSGYFALLEAVKTYDPEKSGGFLTWLSYYLRKEFARTGGYEKRRRDPLDSALSLDAPISDEDDETYLETVEDRRDDYADAEEKIYTEQLHNALEGALSSLPAAQADTLRSRYWEGKELRYIAQEIGVSTQAVEERERQALRAIRRSSHARDLYKYLDDQTDFYRKISVDRCRTEHTSSVEEIVLWRESMLEQWEKGNREQQ